MAFDNKALWNLSYGMYVVGARTDDIVNAQIANTVIQVSNKPPSIAVSISKNCYTHELIEKSGAFSVSVLEQETSMEFIGNFGFRCGREFDKFAKVKYETGVTGSPIVKEHALAIIESKLTGKLDSGTHTVFVGDVVACEVVKQGEPLTYAYYQNVKKGKAHKNAPTFKG